MWKKVVANEHRKHNEIIDNALKVVVEWQCVAYVPKLEVQVLAHERQMQKVEINRLRPSMEQSTVNRWQRE
jgi:hypothetical protein